MTKSTKKSAKRPSKEARREAMKKRTQENAKNREGGNWSRALDFKGEEVKFFKPKKGKNKIDILPYTVKTKHHPQGVEAGFEDYVLDIFVHTKVGPKEGSYICPKRTFGKPCPICEEHDHLKKEGETDDDELRDLAPKHRVFYNLIDLKNEDEGVQLWEVSHFLFEKELLEEAEASEEEFVAFADLEEGRTIQFRASEVSKGGYNFMEYKSFAFLDRDEIDEDILDETYSLDEYMIIVSYDELHAAFIGEDEADEDEDDDDEDDDEEEVKTKKKSSKKSKKVVEDEDEDDEDEDEDDEDDEDEDEDDDDDEDEEDDIPVKQKKPTGKSSKKGNKTIAKEEKKSSKKSSKKASSKKSSKKSKKKYPDCPNDHKYGKDCDEHDDCTDCELWDPCADAKDEMNE